MEILDLNKTSKEIIDVLIRNRVSLKDFKEISNMLINEYENQILKERLFQEQKKWGVVKGVNPKITTPKPKHPE